MSLRRPRRTAAQRRLRKGREALRRPREPRPPPSPPPAQLDRAHAETLARALLAVALWSSQLDATREAVAEGSTRGDELTGSTQGRRAAGAEGAEQGDRANAKGAAAATDLSFRRGLFSVRGPWIDLLVGSQPSAPDRPA